MLPRAPFPRPSAATVDKVRSALNRALGDSKLITSEEGCAGYSADESEQDAVVPDAVVLATSADDIAATLAVCSDLQVPVTPRAGGTGKSGGAVPVCGGVTLCTLGMNGIKEINHRELIAVVEPGLVLERLQAAVEGEGLFYPPDPNSQADCALGGNIAENAGGPRALKYGVTRDYVLGLEVITAEGKGLRTGHRTVKGVTGYDLTALLTGSEGTLAVTLEATLRLIRKPDGIVTLLGLFDSVERCAKAVAQVIAAGLVPRCLELVDEACLTAMRAEGVALDGRAGALLITELDGDPDSCDRDMERMGEVLTEAGALDVLVAQDAAQRDRLWATRRELTNVVRKLAKHKIAEDVVVPRGQVARLVTEVQAIAERNAVRMLCFGHAGDGNLHVSTLWDDPDDVAAVAKALDDLFHAVVALGGTLTGEHGVGTSKAEYLPVEQSAELIEVQRNLKAMFDPKGILNPGKIFPRAGHHAMVWGKQ